MLTVRTNILLTKDDHLTLKTIAQEKNKTIGELIREAVRKTYGSKDSTEYRKQIIAELDNLAKRVNTKGINYKEMIILQHYECELLPVESLNFCYNGGKYCNKITKIIRKIINNIFLKYIF